MTDWRETLSASINSLIQYSWVLRTHIMHLHQVCECQPVRAIVSFQALSRCLFIILYGLLLAKPLELSIKRRCRQNGRNPYDNQDRHGDSQANRRAPAIRLATRQRCAQMELKPLWDASFQQTREDILNCSR